MNMIALRLSLTYGQDPRWYERLSREDQALVYAYDTRDQRKKGRTQ